MRGDTLILVPNLESINQVMTLSTIDCVTLTMESGSNGLEPFGCLGKCVPEHSASVINSPTEGVWLYHQGH